MPYHRRTPTQPRPDRMQLVRDLERELREPHPIGQPVILEDETPETNSLRLYVIWDRWEECDRDARSQVILDAYHRAFGIVTDRSAREIRLALGVTVPEAAGIGLLPLVIRPTRRDHEPDDAEEYHDAMIQAGASTLIPSGALELRCATEDDAKATLAFLKDKLPGSEWMVIREVDRGDE